MVYVSKGENLKKKSLSKKCAFATGFCLVFDISGDNQTDVSTINVDTTIKTGMDCGDLG